MRHSSVHTPPIEDEATRIFRRAAPKTVTPRRARARARLLMVAALAALLAARIYGARQSVSFASAKAALPVSGSDVLGLHREPVVTALSRAYLPSSSVHLTALGLDLDTTGLSLEAVSPGGVSLGEPHRGRLRGGAQLPENPGLYIVRRPEYAYGSTHAVMHLQLALAKFRKQSGYTGPLIVSDLSGPRGGPHSPHISHQSGRDADVWLPLRCDAQGVTLKGGDAAIDPIDFAHFSAAQPDEVDWDASWQLVKALVRTGQVESIFLARANHGFLRQAAMRDGLPREDADTIIQDRDRPRGGVVRHARGHDKHLHIRFHCADYETNCR